MKKDFTKTRWCWLARETKDGWRLYFAADKDYPVTGVLFADKKQVEVVTKGRGNTVFIHMDDTKKPAKRTSAAKKKD
jgi:hypothetical protein